MPEKVQVPYTIVKKQDKPSAGMWSWIGKTTGSKKWTGRLLINLTNTICF
jgi:hypothetical protein